MQYGRASICVNVCAYHQPRRSSTGGGLQLVIPPNLRSRSRSPADQQRARLEAMASQMAKDKEEHEKRMAEERKEIAALKAKVQENNKARQMQKQKQEEALRAAREEEERMAEEEEERQMSLALIESRKAFDKEAQRNKEE